LPCLPATCLFPSSSTHQHPCATKPVTSCASCLSSPFSRCVLTLATPPADQRSVNVHVSSSNCGYFSRTQQKSWFIGGSPQGFMGYHICILTTSKVALYDWTVFCWYTASWYLYWKERLNSPLVFSLGSRDLVYVLENWSHTKSLFH
jgi:hypothetical protein